VYDLPHRSARRNYTTPGIKERPSQKHIPQLTSGTEYEIHKTVWERRAELPSPVTVPRPLNFHNCEPGLSIALPTNTRQKNLFSGLASSVHLRSWSVVGEARYFPGSVGKLTSGRVAHYTPDFLSKRAFRPYYALSFLSKGTFAQSSSPPVQRFPSCPDPSA
jgi:hypothetical protein